MHLAERQKNADVKELRIPPPPSARQMNWREGVYFPRKTQVLADWRRQLAEGVSHAASRLATSARH
jgi:hypothetical protein